MLIVTQSFAANNSALMKIELTDGGERTLSISDGFTIAYDATNLVFGMPENGIKYIVADVNKITYGTDGSSSGVDELEQGAPIVEFDGQCIKIKNNLLEVKCNVFTADGNVVESFSCAGNQSIDLSHLSSNFYIVEILSGKNRIANFKFIKK